MRTSKCKLWIVAVLLCGGGCGSHTALPPVDWTLFRGERAMEHVETLVGFGPRPSGSDELKRAGDYIAEQLRNAGLEVREQSFTALTVRGETRFRNIIGKTRGTGRTNDGVIIFGSHYDTKWMPDIRFVGANDSGSSTGVLLEMARHTVDQPAVWHVFFDGEECLEEYGEDDGLWGSRYFVDHLQTEMGLAPKDIRAFILLDMVGDRNLTITIPISSTGWLVRRVLEGAKALGMRKHFSYGDRDVLDDHVPFVQAGIPSVNLIDFEFGSQPGLNDYWHTEEDTLDKISANSLELIGHIALWLLHDLRTRQTP